jgi:hypothetical protein
VRVPSVNPTNGEHVKIALEGPINKCADVECIDWRQKVIMSLGDRFTFHNPMDFDCRGKEVECEQELVDFDTAGIASSGIVLVMADKPGWGTAMAVQMAWAMHKVIVVVCGADSVSPWLRNRSTVIKRDLDSAIEWIRKEYGSER